MTRIALAQVVPTLGNIEENTERILRHLGRAQEEKADLFLTPELALIGYGCGDLFLDRVAENLEALDRIRKEVKDCYAVIGYVEEDEEGLLHNAAALLREGRVLGTYRKAHLANYRLFDEKRYFQPGNTCPVFETSFGKIGIAICEDLWHPEPSRAMALRGARLIACLSSSPYNWGKPDLWEAFLRERVNDNLCYLAFCNQAGCQDGATYWGGSMVLSPRGEVVARAKLIEEDFVVAEIDLREVERVRSRDLRVREVRREILEDLLRAYEEREGIEREEDAPPE
jgi:NAD+ synthase (glutamine-hydrolysing)